MKNKKIFSLISAVCLATSIVAPTVSSAIFNVQDTSNTALEKFNDSERYVKLDNKYTDLFFIRTGEVLLPWTDEQIEQTDFYLDLESNTILALIPYKTNPYLAKNTNQKTAMFNLTDETTAEQVNELLTETFGYECSIEKYWNNPDYKYQITGSEQFLKKVCNLMKNAEFSDSFVIPTGYVQIETFEATLRETPVEYWFSNEREKEFFENYLTEHKIGELIPNKECIEKYHLNVSDENTVDEIFEAALKVYEETGKRPDYYIPESMNTSGTGIIDVFNSIDGDANNDGVTNIADATAIIQAIGNPDKYALTEQGYFNADTDGDGLTGLDAVAIQRKLAGI